LRRERGFGIHGVILAVYACNGHYRNILHVEAQPQKGYRGISYAALRGNGGRLVLPGASRRRSQHFQDDAGDGRNPAMTLKVLP
jgi:hypothetical protein